MDVNDPATVKKVMRLLVGGRSVALYPEGRVVRCAQGNEELRRARADRHQDGCAA